MTDNREMMAILAALESLLSEFHSSCSNDRKRGIEEQLSSFSRQSNACELSLTFILHTENVYVQMFAANIVERFVQQSWYRLMSDEKLTIRRLIGQAMLSESGSLAKFVRNKLCKILVDIGRYDWPHAYPDFFNNIISLLNNPSTRLVGVILIKTASEEFISPKEELPVTRRKELRDLLMSLAPQLLASLNGILEDVVSQSQSSPAVSRPPSPMNAAHPTGSLKSSAPVARAYIEAACSTINASRTRTVKQNWRSDIQNLNPTCILSPETLELSVACLSTIEHFTSWMPIESNFGPTTLNTIFAFIWLGCGDEGNIESAATAISVINELIHKKRFQGRDAQQCLFVVFENTYKLLILVMQRPNVDQIDLRLLCKLEILVRNLVENNLTKFPGGFANDACFEFLNLIKRFTFSLTDDDLYINSLDTWLCFLDLVESIGMSANCEQFLGTLLVEVTNRLLSDDRKISGNDDDDNEAVAKSLQIIVQISELSFRGSASHLISMWDCAVSAFDSGGTLESAQCSRTAILARIIGCLSSGLATIDGDSTVIHVFLKLTHDPLKMVKRCEFYQHLSNKVFISSQILEDIIQVERECLASIQTYIHLLKTSLATQNSAESIQDTVCEIAEAALQICLSNEKCAAQSAGVLMAITSRFPRLRFVETMYPKLVELVSNISHLDNVQLVKNCAICLQNICILPWTDAQGGTQSVDQKWELRKSYYSTIINILLNPAKQANNNDATSQIVDGKSSPNQNSARTPPTKHLTITFDIATSMVEALSSGCPSRHMGMVATCFENFLNASEPFFIAKGQNIEPEIGERMMAFYRACLQVFPSKLDSLMDRLLDVNMACTSWQSSEIDAKCVAYIESVLDLLREVVMNQTKSAIFLERILKFAIQFWNVTGSGEAEVLRPALIKLFHSTLLNHWRHFFPTNVAQLFTPSGSPSLNGEVANEDKFCVLMELYGWALVQQTRDIAVFGEVLRSLQELDSKWKLFKRPIFEGSMISEFIDVLLKCLLWKSHELYREEISLTLYAMVQSVSLVNFREVHMPRFLSRIEGLHDHHKSHLISSLIIPDGFVAFSEKLNDLFVDVRYFVMSSQPTTTPFQFQ